MATGITVTSFSPDTPISASAMNANFAAIVSGVNTLLPPGGSGGNILSTDGSGNYSWIPEGGTGTVTSIATGTGLSGGPRTSSGTISIATSGVTSAHLLDGTVGNIDISSSAAIDRSKIAASSSGDYDKVVFMKSLRHFHLLLHKVYINLFSLTESLKSN